MQTQGQRKLLFGGAVSESPVFHPWCACQCPTALFNFAESYKGHVFILWAAAPGPRTPAAHHGAETGTRRCPASGSKFSNARWSWVSIWEGLFFCWLFLFLSLPFIGYHQWLRGPWCWLCSSLSALAPAGRLHRAGVCSDNRPLSLNQSPGLQCQMRLSCCLLFLFLSYKKTRHPAKSESENDGSGIQM